MTVDTSSEAGSLAVLEAHLRRLGTEECASLVADLWRERGYQVTRSDTSVTAVDGARTTTIHVGEHPQRGTPDILVTRDGRPGHTAARVLDTAALAERLWYAIDRSAARELCRRHFGATPGELRLPPTVRIRRQLSNPPSRAVFAVSVCILAILVTGVAAVGFTDASGTAPSADAEPTLQSPTTVTEAPPGQTPPPGVTTRSVDDLNTLAAAHQRATTDRSLTVWIDTTSTTFEGGTWRRERVDTDVATDGERYEIRVSEGPRSDRQPVWTLYHDGNRSIIRDGTGQNASFRRYPTGERAVRSYIEVPTPRRVAGQLVIKYLSTPTTNVTRVDIRRGGPAYRIAGSGQPRSSQLEGVSNYTVTATVTPEGFVTSLNASYTVVRNGTSFRASYQVRYGRLNRTTVTAPEWYERRVLSQKAITPGSRLSVA